MQGRAFQELGTASSWTWRNETPHTLLGFPSNSGWFVGELIVARQKDGGRDREFGHGHVYTAMFKVDNQQGPTV